MMFIIFFINNNNNISIIKYYIYNCIYIFFFACNITCKLVLYDKYFGTVVTILDI